MGGEILSAGKDVENLKAGTNRLPDLKESFSLGPENSLAGMPPRVFPQTPVNFEATWTEYYSSMESLAQKLLEAFAISLKLNENYFDEFTDKHASAIRALNYPAMDVSYCQSVQTGSNFNPELSQFNPDFYPRYKLGLTLTGTVTI